MSRRPLPYDIIERFGHLPDATYRGGNEFSSACPKCGGGRGGRDLSDRFRMWERQGQASNYWCRRCGFQGFTDDNKPGKQMTEAEILELDEIRVREAAKEEKRLQAKIDELRKAAYWQGWHDAMTSQHRKLWRDQGIPDSLQDWFKLGAIDKRTFYNGERPFTSQAMTIPHFDVGWNAVNIQYRIIDPPAGVGKYRYTAGLPAPLFLTDPDNEPAGATILVEGAKKAIVLYAQLGHKYTVTAVPSKMPGAALIERLVNCDPLYIVLDPDAYVGKSSAVARIGDMVGDRARFVRLPAKPDDLITKYGLSANNMMQYIKQGTLRV